MAWGRLPEIICVFSNEYNVFSHFFDTKTINAAHTSTTSKWLGRNLMGSDTDRHHLQRTGVCSTWRQSACWCTFMLLLDFIIVDANVVNMHPELTVWSQKFSVKANYSVIWFTEDSLQRLYQRTFPPTGIRVPAPHTSVCLFSWCI